MPKRKRCQACKKRKPLVEFVVVGRKAATCRLCMYDQSKKWAKINNPPLFQMLKKMFTRN